MGQDQAVVGLDEIIKQLGPFGKFNIINYTLLLFPIFLAGMYGSVFVFEAPDISYRCEITECEGNHTSWVDHAFPQLNGEPSKCERYGLATLVDIDDNNFTCASDIFNKSVVQGCTDYVYVDEDSAVRDFDLGCQDGKRTLIGTFHNAGLFVSLLLTGIMSDKFGRKWAVAVPSLMNGVFGFMRSYSTSYEMLVILEFLEAALGAGAYSTAFVLAMELVGPKGRVFGNTLINTVYVFGLMALAGLSWLLQDWRALLRLIYAPACFVFGYIFILDESARWLLSKGRNEEAIKVLERAARMNRIELTEHSLIPLKDMKDETQKTNVENEAKPKSNFLRVIKSSVIRKRVFVCSFLWITCTFVYYGLSINSVSLAGNKYVNFMLVGFVEIPANFACLFALDRYGRKKTLVITYVLSACVCISLSLLPKDEKWWSLFLYLSGKFCITVAYSSVYIYVSEVFPTSVRQSLLAVCSSLGRVGSTLAPLTPLLALYYNNLPAIFFGSLALVASVMVFTLPETINLPLPNTIEEAERLSKPRKFSDGKH